jgi:membrane protease YdiL (CAAX protease family)
MLWKKTWRPETVMLLAGGILFAFFTANLTVDLLRRASVAGFRTPDDSGSVLLATLGFHGAAIAAGILFLKLHGIGWREISGLNTVRWPKQFLFIIGALAIALPVMFGLKFLSEFVLKKMGWPVEDQRAVELILAAKSTALKIYLGGFAVILAPLAEEFIFRGLLFSGFKKIGWPKCGWILVSLLFALIHASAPIFLPLFVFALALTWLYEKTEGLLAPVIAHSLFNAANLGLLIVQVKLGGLPK